ncbi:MFS transporter [Micromonospora sp. WMMD1082]|uniref:MFS transporter n=1 Tax=Micromonospora sp. WMMD1082 TaxID=3016104 RepID=UPI002415F289|nr:MFS transporter [Micromonospora sp. WMMD1082]MDG4792985.1 MFS transporter [Micromonospora sp. WMMD1082]
MSARAEPAVGRSAVAVLAVATFGFAVTQTAIVPSLDAMATAFAASRTDVAWTLSAHLVSAAVWTPVMGRLGDMFGKRRLLVVALLLFAAGSVVAAAGPGLGWVVAGRIIQGAGGGIFPLGFGIARDVLPPRRLPGSIGLLSAISGIGAGLGLVVGGLLTDHATYRWIFWLGAGVAALSTLAVWLFLPASSRRAGGTVDVRGAVLVEGRTPDPLVHIPALVRPTVLLTNVATVFVAFGMFGAFVLLPQIAQAPTATGYGLGVSATVAGLLLLPGSLAMLVTGPLSGLLGRRFGARLSLVLGALVTAAGLFLLARDLGRLPALLGYSLVVFAGIGLALAAMPNLVIEAVPAGRTGQATGVNALVRSVGSALGAQIAATVVAASALPGGSPTAAGYGRAFLLAGLASVAAALVGALIPNGRATGAGRVVVGRSQQTRAGVGTASGPA